MTQKYFTDKPFVRNDTLVRTAPLFAGKDLMFSVTKYRSDIQALRGLSVLAVLLYHAEENFFPLGYLGVDVFFVISGFVVTPLILRIFADNSKGQLCNLIHFYKRRFYRLAPALAVSLTLSAVIIFLLGPISDHERFAKQGIATFLLVGNFGAYRYSGNYFSPNPNPLVHTWSLSLEEQIYIFLPLILILIIRIRRFQGKYTTLFVVILVVSFVSYLFPTIWAPLYSRAGIDLPSQVSFYSPLDRIWQFLAGGIVFLLSERPKNHHRVISKVIQLLTTFSVIAMIFGPYHMGSKISSILTTLFAVLVILWKSLDAIPDFLSKKLEWVGNRSYSIYLAHMPLLYTAKYSPVTQIGTGSHLEVQIIVALVFSILLGSLSYSKIENRFRYCGNTKVSGLKTISVALVLTHLLPLSLFIFMDVSRDKLYWGLNRNIQQPTYAGVLDPRCDRDTEFGAPCFYKSMDASKTVLLIGDSHAAQISQAVVDAAQMTKWNAIVWAHSDCQVQFKRDASEQVSDNCIDINNSMKEWVKKNKPHAIIVSQFITPDSPQISLRHALTILRSLAPNILLIENNPVFPDDKDFMVERPIVMPAYKPPKSFHESMMVTVEKKASDLLASWARSNGIATISLDSLFCTEGVCSRYSDKGWLYIDDDHLSVAGAELAIPQLIAYLKQL